MPVEMQILSKYAAGLEGLRQVAAQVDPLLRVEPSDGCVQFVHPTDGVVASMLHPVTAQCTGDVTRCADIPPDIAPGETVWSEGVIPFAHLEAGLRVLTGVAVATEGNIMVRGLRP